MMTMTITMQPTKSSMTTITQTFAGVPLAGQATLDSPIGPLTALATAKGLAGLWFDAQKHHPGDLDAPMDATTQNAQSGADHRIRRGRRSVTSPCALARSEAGFGRWAADRPPGQ